MTTIPSPERQRGCRECGNVNHHKPTCILVNIENDGFDSPVLDSERADRQPPAEGRHEFKGHESTDFCVYPVSELDFCDEPRSAPIHQAAEDYGERPAIAAMLRQIADAVEAGPSSQLVKVAISVNVKEQS